MKQMTIPVKDNAKIALKASDDLSIEGTQEKYLTAIVRHGESLKISEHNEGLEIKATTDCRLMIPETATVTVEKVGGDLAVSGFANRVIVGKIGGDLTLENLAGASVEMVGADIRFKNISGTLEIARVGGDLDGEGVIALSSRAVGGDASLIGINGTVDLSAGGDVDISSNEENLPPMTLRAGGDVKLYVGVKANAQLEMLSGGEEISVHACGQEGDWEEGMVSLPLGEGGSLIRMEAGDSITVTDQESAPRDFEDLIEETREGWHDFGIDLERTIRDSMNVVSGTIEEAVRKAEKASEMAGIKIELSNKSRKNKGTDQYGKQKVVGFSYNEPEKKSDNLKGKMSDEERMMVLRMLQEKKISVEEAEKLLNALDR